MTTPFIIPFFLMNRGCPYRCVYCNQLHSVAAPNGRLQAQAVADGIADGLASPRLEPGRRVEAAFYGGTFTNLPLAEQEVLLDAAAVFLKQGRLSGVRVSTRPDALASDQIDFLQSHGVTTIEIGAQSMDDAVLAASGRGHTSGQTREAAGRVKQAGIQLGLQLLPGLPGEDDGSRRKTLEEVIALKPDLARLYPLLVIKGTLLADMFQKGAYQPLSLEKAVAVCADIYRELTDRGVIVMRMGLQEDPKLVESLMAGPYHPAFGDLVLSEIYYRRLFQVLESTPSTDSEMVIRVAPPDLSQALGHRRANITRLAERFYRGLEIRAEAGLPRGHFLWQGKEFFTRGEASA